jgi:hypothetical protein
VKVAVNLREVAEDLGDTDDGKVLGVDDRVASGGTHALSANPEKLQRRIAALQGFDELGAVHFPGRFSGGDQDSHGDILTLPDCERL